MPLGKKRPTATFEQALNIIPSSLKWQISLAFLDDVKIFCTNTEQHAKDTKTVLGHLAEAGVSRNLEKGLWFSKEVDYLGHIVLPGQPHVHNKNVDALTHVKLPTTETQLKRFLGMCSVY